MKESVGLSSTIQTAGKSHPRVAVVIGTIGVRAAAALPLFELLKEENISVDLLVGSSSGAWLAAMYGAGYSTDEMQQLIGEMQRAKFFSQTDFRTILGFVHPKFARAGGMSTLKKSDRQQEIARRLFGTRRLEDLQPTVILQSADCITGEPVTLTKGLVAEAVYAANALAPYFPPQNMDGQWLADGAYVRPVPIIEAVKRQADIIIVLFHEEAPKPNPEDLLEANYNILAAYFSRLIKDQIMMAIDLHHHETILIPLKLEKYVGPWEANAIPQILQAGKAAVESKRKIILETV